LQIIDNFNDLKDTEGIEKKVLKFDRRYNIVFRNW